MKTPFRALLVLAAAVMLPIASRGQLTYSLGSGSYSAIQTFTGFTSLSSVTWQVITPALAAPATANFNMYVAQWNTDSNVVSPGTLQAFGAVGVVGNPLTNIAGGVATNLTFNGTWTAVDSSSVYALVLSYFSGDQNFGALYGPNTGNAFLASGGLGYAFTSSDLGSFQNDLETSGAPFGINGTAAYTLSVTGGLAPAPEPKTAAAGISVLFVAVLIGRRAMLRRQGAAGPIAA